jgi:hypothetical protein
VGLTGIAPALGANERDLLIAIRITIRIEFSRALGVLLGSRLFLLGSDCLLTGLCLRPLSSRAAKLGFLTVATRFNSLGFEPPFLSLPACYEKRDQDQDSYDYQDNDEAGAHRGSSLGAANIPATTVFSRIACAVSRGGWPA